jgi:hypothetical protein
MPTNRRRIRQDDIHRFIEDILPFIDLKTEVQTIGVLVVDDGAPFRRRF